MKWDEFMHKICFIVGSPRRNRSCNFLIDKAIEGVKEVSDEVIIKKVQISEFRITPCNGCDACLRAPHDCPLAEEDDTKKIEEEILGSSAIFVAAPNYFGSVSSQLKTLIDRSRPWKMKNYLLKDVFFSPLASTGLRNGGEGVISDLINFALIQGMIIVGNAMGSPVIEENIPITSLQKYNLKEFLGKDEIDELAGLIAKNLGIRVASLLKKFNL